MRSCLDGFGAADVYGASKLCTWLAVPTTETCGLPDRAESKHGAFATGMSGWRYQPPSVEDRWQAPDQRGGVSERRAADARSASRRCAFSARTRARTAVISASAARLPLRSALSRAAVENAAADFESLLMSDKEGTTARWLLRRQRQISAS